ncbi:MAG: holo-ACP synthase [Candidatus Pacearchaeota archaeon]
MVSVGTDIVEIKKIKNYLEREDFLFKTFTQREIRYANTKDSGKRKAEHLATTFAGKEAVFKALGIEYFEPQEIEILREKKGKPYVRLLGKIKELVGDKKIEVSLSFSKDSAIGFAIAS